MICFRALAISAGGVEPGLASSPSTSRRERDAIAESTGSRKFGVGSAQRQHDDFGRNLVEQQRAGALRKARQIVEGEQQGSHRLGVLRPCGDQHSHDVVGVASAPAR